VTLRLAHVVIIYALVITTSGVARGAVVAADEGCCAPCDHAACPEDGTEDSSTEGCPLPCSDCVCAAHVAPAIITQHVTVAANAPEQVIAAAGPDLPPETRFLPGVFRPPRRAA
jgi:hypothetical protein